MKIGAVVLNYNGYEKTERVVKYLINNSNVSHVAVVDNCSTDNSYEILKKIECGKVTVQKTVKNNGFAAGNNYGIRFLIDNYSPEYIAVVGSDIILEDDLIDKCVKILEEDSSVGVVSSRIKDIGGIEENSAWKFPTYKQYIMFCNHYHLAKGDYQTYYTAKDNSDREFVDVVRGSFMFFRTKALVDVNCFDEGIFLYNEENIISKKLKELNYKVVWITDKFYIHDHTYSKYCNIKSEINKYKYSLESNRYYLENYVGLSSFESIKLRISEKIGLLVFLIFKLLKLVFLIFKGEKQ